MKNSKKNSGNGVITKMINAEFTNEINDLVTENLYQWDNYQTLKISGIDFASVTPKIHFANKKSTEALVVQAVLKSDGICEVSIPNSLLAEKYDIIAYVYINTGLTYKTIKSITIPVIPRLKPTNYTQPSDEQIAEIEEIELQAKAILDGLYISEYDSTKAYKRPNIVYYNHSSYMCISNTEITGVLPTDTTKWKLMAKGAVVTGLTKDSSGNLVFIFSDGTSYTVDMVVKDAELVDEDDIPALRLTSEEVDKIKNNKIGIRIEGHFDDDYEPNYYKVTLPKPGLYYYWQRNSGSEVSSGLFVINNLDYEEGMNIPGSYDPSKHELSINVANVDDVIYMVLVTEFMEWEV